MRSPGPWAGALPISLWWRNKCREAREHVNWSNASLFPVICGIIARCRCTQRCLRVWRSQGRYFWVLPFLLECPGDPLGTALQMRCQNSNTRKQQIHVWKYNKIRVPATDRRSPAPPTNPTPTQRCADGHQGSQTLCLCSHGGWLLASTGTLSLGQGMGCFHLLNPAPHQFLAKA